MKKFNKILGMTAVAAATFSLASCQNELDGSISGGNSSVDGVSLVKAPDITAWSGSQTLGNTLAGVNTRGNQEAPYWNGEAHIKPNDVTEVEMNYVVEYFKTHHGKSDAVERDFKNFYVQQVYYSDEYFEAADGQRYDAKGCVNQIQTGPQWNGDNVFGGNDEFNKCRYLYDSSSLDFWYNNTKCSYWSNNFKMVYIPGYGYYVGFDVEGQPEDFQPDNKNMHITNSPDGWYYDRIIKIVPADEKGNIIPLEDNTNNGDSDPDNGDEGDNSGSGENGGNNNGNNTPSVNNRHGNEVEVNYAILDSHPQYGLADLVTKLSIHVRKATNVELKIPVPNKYVVESDDLYIFKEHYTGVYGDKNLLDNQSTEVSYEIKNADGSDAGTVTLHVEFKSGDSSLGTEFSEGYIYVWTEGIDKNVIDACWETNQDGINFEIFNYFQTENVVWDENDTSTTVEEVGDHNRSLLFQAMNKSKIYFKDNYPNYYINALGYNEALTNFHPYHAIVEPTDDYTCKYHNVTHLNGTPYNDIWVHNSVNLIDDAHRH